MGINISVPVQYNGEFLPDIILLTQSYLRGTRLNSMHGLCTYNLSNIVLNLIFRSEPLRAQSSTIIRSIPSSKQDVWSAPQSESTFKSFFMPSSPTGSY